MDLGEGGYVVFNTCNICELTCRVGQFPDFTVLTTDCVGVAETTAGGLPGLGHGPSLGGSAAE